MCFKKKKSELVPHTWVKDKLTNSMQTLPFCYIMPKRTHAEMDSDNIESYFDLIFNTSNDMNCSSDFNKSLTAIKKRVLSDLSFKEETQAATDFTLDEAIRTFRLKYVEFPCEFVQNHKWDIEKDMGKEEFSTTSYIGETLTLMPSCLNHIIKT